MCVPTSAADLWAERRLEVALVVGFGLATQVEVWSGLLVGGPRPLIAAVNLSAAVSLWWIRRRPLIPVTAAWSALALGGLLGVDAGTTVAPLLMSVVTSGTAGRYARRPGWALVLTLALSMMTYLVYLGHGLGAGDAAWLALLAAGPWVAGGAVAISVDRAVHAEREAVLAQVDAEHRSEVAVREERARIARELHDIVTHGITSMTLHASGVRRLLAPDQEQERAALGSVEETGRQTLEELRRMLGVLREASQPAPTAPQPTLSDVDSVLDVARAAGVSAALSVVGAPSGPVPAGMQLSAFRILQEAVTNVIRHSAARNITCTITYLPQALELDVVNDGPPATPHPPIGTRAGSNGRGQTGMRERAALFGGMVNTGPLPQGGYRVHATLPRGCPGSRGT